MPGRPSTVAMYLRVSLEDDNIDESDSIKNQRDLLCNYIREHPVLSGYSTIEILDDGYSGTSMDRPGMNRLLKQVKMGQISCIIVKDFSRFGRNYIEVGNYLEQVFPFMGVRFISVNDRFDSFSQKSRNSSLEMAFKNLLYDLYSKDLSQKVKSARQTKMQKGDFTSPYAFFGYKKSSQDKNKLEVDEQAALVVKRIFEQVCLGKTTLSIAKALNNENIPTPMSYKKKQNCNRGWNNSHEENFWSKDAITRIIRDERYTGKMICGKRQRTVVGKKSTAKITRSDWIKVEGTHEGIISKEDFDKAQSCLNIFKEKNKTKDKGNILQGKIRCGHCGYTMRFKSCSQPYYFCHTAKYKDGFQCANGSISQQDIKSLLLSLIQKQLQLSADAFKVIHELKQEIRYKSLLAEQECTKTRRSMDNLSSLRLSLYEDYKQEKLTKEQYISRRDSYLCKEEALSIQLQNQQKRISLLQEQKLSENLSVEKFLDAFISELTNEAGEEFISQVLIYDAERIEIKFNCSDPFKQIVSF